MTINAATSALHLNLPSTSAGRSPSIVTVHPSVLAQILDHQSRKPADQHRVIGALLGVRSSESGATGSSSEIEIRNCFALPHAETEEQVAVDMDYYKSMMELMNRVGANREVLVGWYSSSPEITAPSALFQNFFDDQTSTAGPAIHLTFDTNLHADNIKSSLALRAYVAREVGSVPKAENCIFLPVPCSVKYQMTEKAGLDMLVPRDAKTQNPLPPLQNLSQSIALLIENIEQMEEYVREVSAGTKPANPEVGKYLLEAVGRWKTSDLANNQSSSSIAASLGLAGEDDESEEGVRKGVQEFLSVSYLSALVRTQAELTARLQLLV